MRLSAILLGVSFLLIAFAAQSFGAVSFVHEKTFTVPNLDSITQMKLVSQQGGTSLSVLATNGHLIQLYDQASESVLFSKQADSNQEILKVEMADVNRDSVPDIVAVRIAPSPDFYLYPTYTYLDIYRSCDTANSISLTIDTVWGVIYGAGYLGGPVLEARDFDNDGYPELLTSVEKVDGFGTNTTITSWTNGLTTKFYSAPDSVAWKSDKYVNGLHQFNDTSGAPTYFASVGYTDFFYGWFVGYQIRSTIYLYDLLSDGLAQQMAAKPRTLPPCSHTENRFGCVGDLIPGNGKELITHYHTSSQDCRAYPPLPPTITQYLEARTFVTADSADLDWSLDISGTNYSNFAYHPMLPGYFFAFSGDTLLMFRGSDGTIRDRITTVPSGTKRWDYLYGDSIPRLVVVNGAAVSIYHLDIATDVTDQDSPENIPMAFGLHDPYPNPFNPSTMLSLDTGPGGSMTLAVYNIRGQLVTTLFDGMAQPNTRLKFIWNAGKAASGVYFARLELAGDKRVKKMLLLK
ncbi:MAG: T9SS type A sorting domain-containing protein [Candidatus Zixiibacteriota bacterium]